MSGVPDGYIPYVAARATQAAELEQAIPRLDAGVGELVGRADIGRTGAVLLGIGASLAAACAPVWTLRRNGVDAWRLGAGDAPLPLAVGDRSIVGISQSGRSAETLESLRSVPDERRFAVVNASRSPIADLVNNTLSLGDLVDSYASTIGYTATIVALGMLADRVVSSPTVGGWADMGARFAEAESGAAPAVDAAVGLMVDVPWVDVVATGPAAGSAEEGALLLREVTRMPATAMSTRQYLHGAMESAGRGAHLLIGDDREHRLAEMLLDAGHLVTLITATTITSHPLLVTIPVPAADASQRAVFEAAVLQAIASGLADARGVEVEEFVFHNDDIKVTTPGAA